MSVSRIVLLASQIANGNRSVKFPAMTFSDLELLFRCISEAKADKA